MSSFTREWVRQRTRTGIVYRPTVDLLFREGTGYNLYSFIVDSGADISLAPRQLAQRLGVEWVTGTRVRLSGISPRPECSVDGRVHTVHAIVPELAHELKLSICFAEGDAPYLVGREGFFDKFKVTLDKTRQRTVFAPAL